MLKPFLIRLTPELEM